jgi:hypothetical protein
MSILNLFRNKETSLKASKRTSNKPLKEPVDNSKDYRVCFTCGTVLKTEKDAACMDCDIYL